MTSNLLGEGGTIIILYVIQVHEIIVRLQKCSDHFNYLSVQTSIFVRQKISEQLFEYVLYNSI